MTGSRKICVELLLACGCIHVQYLDSIIEEVTIENIWRDRHFLQPVTKVGEPYRDLEGYLDSVDLKSKKNTTTSSDLLFKEYH